MFNNTPKRYKPIIGYHKNIVKRKKIITYLAILADFLILRVVFVYYTKQINKVHIFPSPFNLHPSTFSLDLFNRKQCN
jgi:hypothetical protein